MTKICKKCHFKKFLPEFHQDGDSPDGRKSVCAECKGKEHAAWREKNRVRINKRAKEYRENNRSLVRHAVWKSGIKTKYGLTPEALENLRKSQDNKCACCGDVFDDTPHIDHIHGSDPVIVRGLLCKFCNPGLGNFKDSVSRLLKAAQYLQKFVVDTLQNS